MSQFFKASTLAAKALAGDFKFKAYYNAGFHLETMTCLFCHLSRLLFNLTILAYRLLMLAFSLINPLAWVTVPFKAVDLLDNTLALLLSTVTVALFPVIVFFRTLKSIFFGYEEGTGYDHGEQEEEKDLKLAMAIWSDLGQEAETPSQNSAPPSTSPG